MIVFKSVQWKNFLSTGNSPNKVLLNKSQTTLIIGKNGEGKSTILDALCFSLFGKPFRNINKGQLVNSINGKGCSVEIEFDINGKEYKIIRGIKPNVFEIWLDGEMINQDAASRDYQKILEQQILKLNYKTFTQVVILGSASFVPFMQLPTTQRREVIEDILDIRIFSTMNSLLKEKVQETKDAITTIENEISTAKTKVDSQTQLIKTITEAKTSAIESIGAKISANSTEILHAEGEIQLIISEIDTLKASINDKETIAEDIDKANQSEVSCSRKSKLASTTQSFLANTMFVHRVAKISQRNTKRVLSKILMRKCWTTTQRLVNSKPFSPISMTNYRKLTKWLSKLPTRTLSYLQGTLLSPYSTNKSKNLKLRPKGLNLTQLTSMKRRVS
jgi:DNA repair exonuclease SbcCD ATPase subunit